MITALIKEHDLLPSRYMRACPGRSTDTALDILVKQIHAAWHTDNKIAFFHFLKMTGAYNRVVPLCLLHNLKKRFISHMLVHLITSFLSNKTTSICFPGFFSTPFLSEQGICQGSPLSPIPFLLYNADLNDVCNSPDLLATGIDFVDDTNVWAIGKSTEETCSILKEIHSDFLTWGDMHSASFAPHRYVCIHFPK
jgi:hypothetical protein